MTEEQTPEIDPTTQELIENGIAEVSRMYVDQVMENERLREGATLRDWFAMTTLPAVIEMSSLAYNNSQFDYLAKKAYLIADEMMKARKEIK